VNVFLTGASSGIGEALARHYASEGATPGLFARRDSELARLAAALAPSRVLTYAGDVRDVDALRRAGADFLLRVGVPDIVIGNAGVSHGTMTAEVDDMPAFREVFDINILGLVHTFHPFVATMRDAHRGALVGIASIAGYRGLPGASGYSASKAAAISYLESLRVELHGTGVSVVTICPGYIATPMTHDNPYRMPFLMPAPIAARKMAQAIAAKRRFYAVPWQMAWIGRLLRVLPRPLYDAIFAHAPHKPRKLS